MVKISFSHKFIKEVITLFRKKSLKEIFFGKKVDLIAREDEVIYWLKEHDEEFRKSGGRKGAFVKIDPIHKGIGMAYLLPNKLGNDKTESLILFDGDTNITVGPDLWVYLSVNEDIKKNGLGEHLRLMLLKGNQGGQTYMVNKSLAELQKYKSVVVWCKQFEVLFTYATLF
ncbi:MAG: DM13 domain-containing protein [Candidatus Staskawiczbacteria bacterium]|nr:DM13 domain-containing protein [Candidatus Staskawiczbacteria bacterium]